MLFRGLGSENGVPVSPSQYLGVEPARDADVMRPSGFLGQSTLLALEAMQR
jgi:hypothetical protein